jgi:hypothetical protein
MTDSAIFGLRFQSNEDLQPTREELDRFFEGSKKERGVEKRLDDLSKYLQDLKAVDDYEADRQRGAAEYNFDERKLLGVLHHSHFFNSALKLAIEQYCYHYHRLCALDFKKPRSFVKSAEDEINKLDPKKKNMRVKIAKLQAMADQRNKDLKALEKTRLDLATELKDIAAYVRDNLIRIQKLCESSIAVLVNLQLNKEKEHELIEDIKKQFKEELRDHMQLGPVSRQFAEKVKDDFSQHSKELSQLVLDDIYSITLLFEQIHEHAKKFSTRLDTLIRQAEPKKGAPLEEDLEVLGALDQDLVSLVSDYHFEVKKTVEPMPKDGHERLLVDKRKAMLSHLLDLLRNSAAEQE